MGIIGNIIWFVFGGVEHALLWCLLGILFSITIIGIPVGKQCFKIARLVLWPFGKRIRYNFKNTSFLGNLLWIMIFGWEIAFANLAVGCLFCCTIIGIPFGKQYFKLAKVTLLPFGARFR